MKKLFKNKVFYHSVFLMVRILFRRILRVVNIYYLHKNNVMNK